MITNIGIAHLEFFKTREGILQEKSQMIQDMKTGGSILLNGDDDLLRDMGPVQRRRFMNFSVLERTASSMQLT